MRTNRMMLIAAAGLLTLGAAAAACGDDGDKAPTTVAGTAATTAVAATRPAPTSGATAQATSAQSGGTAIKITVTAKEFSFAPDTFPFSKGKTLEVTFVNAGSATHTFTVYTDEAFTKPLQAGDSGRVVAGAEAVVRFTAPDGNLYFRCEVHPTQMKGEIDVS